MMSLLFFLAIFSFADSALAAETNCEDLSQVRHLYENGDIKKAIAELKILKLKCPQSVDILRTLSDLYWWEGSVRASTEEANAGFALLNPELNSFDETKLHFTDRLHPVEIRANFTELSADQSTGQDYSIEGDARIVGQQHLLFGAYRTSRIYTGNVEAADNRFEVGHIFSFGKSGYWENDFSYSPSATIFARYGVATTPHWVTANDFDLFLSGRLSYYVTEVPNASQVASLIPGFSHSLGENFSISLQEIATHSYHWLYATQGSLSFFPTNRFSATASYASGNVIEGPGLEGNFRAYDLGIKYRLSPSLAVLPNEEIYRGSVRNETDTGLSLEVRF
jgi:hypothetical protein